MQIQVLWVPPAERRFSSGDILTEAELAAFGISANDLLSSGDAQIVPMAEQEQSPAPRTRRAQSAK